MEISNEESFSSITFVTRLSIKIMFSLSLCKIASQKLHVLAWAENYMDLEKCRILVKRFITPQFRYCFFI